MMAQATTAAAMPNALGRSRRGRNAGRGSPLHGLRKVFKDLFDPYRPELHYMRGPGPKWREKHEQLPLG